MERRMVGVLALTGLVACEFPTESPLWDQTWVVPVESIVVGATDLLPEGVAVNEDTTAFTAETPEASIRVVLGEVCTSCLVLNGLRTRKPEFGDTLTTETTLPSELVSATMAGGAFDVVVGHNFNFDPLRPSADPAAPRGYMVFRLSSNGAVVAYDSVSGDDSAFPGGTTLTPDLAVRPVEVSKSIVMDIYIYSPEGDSVTVEALDTAGLMLRPSVVEISRVRVEASSITIDPVRTAMDFSDVDSTVIEHVQSGALLLETANPWNITGTLDVTLEPPDPPIQRSLSLRPGTYLDRLEFSADEQQGLLDAGVVGVEATGSVGSAGPIDVTPAQKLVVHGNLELVVLIGDTEAF